jgi:hypothetical protein
MAEIIGLVGYAGSGKDEAAKHMPGWNRISFADGVREVALAIDPLVNVICDIDTETACRLSELVQSKGWDGAKKHPEVRRLLQRIGTEAGREMFGEDVWVDRAFRKLNQAYLGDGMPCVFTDVRFQNEADAIAHRGGKLIRIHRPGVGPVNNHISDQGIDSIACHGEVWNDGLPETLGARVLVAAI